MALSEEPFHSALAPLLAGATKREIETMALRGCIRVIPDISRCYGSLFDSDGIDLDERTLLAVFRLAISLTSYLHSGNGELASRLWEARIFSKTAVSLGPILDLVSCLELCLGDYDLEKASDKAIDIVSGKAVLPEERLQAALHDAGALQESGVQELLSSAIWQSTPAEINTQVKSLWQAVAIKRKEDDFFFWQRWYDGMLKGEPLPWELQEKVALIPDDIWSQGANVVAKEIRKLELESKTAAYPRLVRDTEAGVFRVEEDPLPPAEIAEFVCKRISLALDAALKSSGPNAFDERTYEVTIIRDTLASEPRSFSILAVGFFDACLALNQNIGVRYPEEVALTNLKNALWAATEELCELDEIAKARCARLAGFNPEKSVDDLDKADLRAIPDFVAPEVDAKAHEIIESDVERALSNEKPVTRSVRIRLTNWLTTISIWMDRAMKGDKRAKWLASIVERLREWLETWPPE